MAIAGAAAAIGAGLLGFVGQERTNLANARQAERQMAFQERMSSSAVQRQVEDYRRAGLNPALAYQQGGSSTPGGAMAAMDESVGRGVSSAKAAREHVQNMRNLKAQELATKEAGYASWSSAAKNIVETRVLGNNAELLQDGIRAENALRAANAAELAKRVELMDVTKQHSLYGLSEARRRSQFWDSTAGSVAPYLSSARDFTGLLNPWLRR